MGIISPEINQDVIEMRSIFQGKKLNSAHEEMLKKIQTRNEYSDNILSKVIIGIIGKHFNQR